MKTTRDAAKYLGISAQTLRHYLKSGTGPRAFMLPGGRRRFRTSDLEEWLNVFVSESPVVETIADSNVNAADD